MRFRTRNGESVRVVSLESSGHITYVHGEWGELGPLFHSAAYATGCVSEDMEVNTELKRVSESVNMDHIGKTADIKSRTRTAIQNAIDGNNLEAFSTQGNPKVNYIKKEVGEKVPNHIISEVWSDMQKDGVAIPGEVEIKNDIT